MGDWLTADFFSIIVAAFLVGTIVGLTGMGGGALMTPALIFLGVGGAATVVTADLTAAAIYKTGGAITHGRQEPGSLDTLLKEAIGFALLFAAATYALRLYINLRRVRSSVGDADPNPPIR